MALRREEEHRKTLGAFRWTLQKVVSSLEAHFEILMPFNRRPACLQQAQRLLREDLTGTTFAEWFDAAEEICRAAMDIPEAARPPRLASAMTRWEGFLRRRGPQGAPPAKVAENGPYPDAKPDGASSRQEDR